MQIKKIIILVTTILCISFAASCGKNAAQKAESNFDFNAEVAYTQISLSDNLDNKSVPIGVSDIKAERSVNPYRNSTEVYNIVFSVTNNDSNSNRENIKILISALDKDGNVITNIGPIQTTKALNYNDSETLETIAPATAIDKDAAVTFKVTSIEVQDADEYECNELIKSITANLADKNYTEAQKTWENVKTDYLEKCKDRVLAFEKKLKKDGYDPNKLSE